MKEKQRRDKISKDMAARGLTAHTQKNMSRSLTSSGVKMLTKHTARLFSLAYFVIFFLQLKIHLVILCICLCACHDMYMEGSQEDNCKELNTEPSYHSIFFLFLFM